MPPSQTNSQTLSIAYETKFRNCFEKELYKYRIPTNRRHFSISCGILEVNKQNMSTVLFLFHYIRNLDVFSSAPSVHSLLLPVIHLLLLCSAVVFR